MTSTSARKSLISDVTEISAGDGDHSLIFLTVYLKSAPTVCDVEGQVYTEWGSKQLVLNFFVITRLMKIISRHLNISV